MIAPRKREAVQRASQNGAELGRQRLLALLEDGEVRGVDGLARDAKMSRLTCRQRLRELQAEGLVEVREQVRGCALVRAKVVDGRTR